MSTEGLPSYQQMMLPVLTAIADGKKTTVEYLPFIQKHFGLSDDQMQELLPSGKETYVANRAKWARSYLKHAELVQAVQRGKYETTPAGQELLDRKPVEITNSLLTQYPSFRDWFRGQTTQKETTLSAKPAGKQNEDLTPQEEIEHSFNQLRSALAEELNEALLSVTPARFEQSIVDLQIAMGYGSGQAEMGRAIGKSGDGGIDGIIDEDKLGLDAVYIQAKRYAPGNTVGRPAIQAFVGSMVGMRANKGVFVTTSDFTSDAKTYVGTIGQRVVLINGERLARLMIDHEVGVKVDKIYSLRSIDANFFTIE